MVTADCSNNFYHNTGFVVSSHDFHRIPTGPDPSRFAWHGRPVSLAGSLAASLAGSLLGSALSGAFSGSLGTVGACSCNTEGSKG